VSTRAIFICGCVTPCLTVIAYYLYLENTDSFDLIPDEKKTVESYGSVYNKLKKDVSAYTKRTIQNNRLRVKLELLIIEDIRLFTLRNERIGKDKKGHCSF
jgi:hypothetical protein